MSDRPLFRVKVCGITGPADAALAAQRGADALGVVFWPGSPRAVDVRTAARALAAAPGVLRVGVFVDAPVDDVARAVVACGLGAVQLAGSEPPAYAHALTAATGVRVVRSVHVDDAGAFGRFVGYPADVFLLDAARDTAPGGTGRSFDWSVARATPWKRARLALAGGLRASNVARALTAVPAAAVDVCSGVELAPGRKDPDALTAFITTARAHLERADRDLEISS